MHGMVQRTTKGMSLLVQAVAGTCTGRHMYNILQWRFFMSPSPAQKVVQCSIVWAGQGASLQTSHIRSACSAQEYHGNTCRTTKQSHLSFHHNTCSSVCTSDSLPRMRGCSSVCTALLESPLFGALSDFSLACGLSCSSRGTPAYLRSCQLCIHPRARQLLQPALATELLCSMPMSSNRDGIIPAETEAESCILSALELNSE